jgi:hypothetical protein
MALEGFEYSANRLWAWSVGPTTPEDVEREMNRVDIRIGGHGLGIDIEQHESAHCSIRKSQNDPKPL